MNPSVLAALSAGLLAALWLSSRRRRPPLLADRASDTVAALNRAQIALVRGEGSTESRPASSDGPQVPGPPGGEPLPEVPPAMLTLRQRRDWILRLRGAYRAGGADRRAAIATARLWGHPDVLPLLREALRDPDPVVMREAARAMEAFRGRRPPQPSSPPGFQRKPLPRNVARMR